MKNKQYNYIKGNVHEEIAATFLQKQGCAILESNFRSRIGEIDLIVEDHGFLVFAEVKYRRTTTYGAPFEAVGKAKQRNISRVSDYYRFIHQISEFTPIRFDVISIYNKQITWIKDAFPYRQVSNK